MAPSRQGLPGRTPVLTGVVGELALMGAVGPHREDLLVAVTVAVEGDQLAVILRHAEGFFAAKPLDRIGPEDIEAYMAAKDAEGLSPKTTSNHLNFLHGMFGFATKRGWATSNPVAATDRPRAPGPTQDIRYLTRDEVERLLDAVPADRTGPTDKALYLTATMCGLRQGELVALRWQDVDAEAGVIRVRRSYSRGKFGAPKSRRGSRAVPMPVRVARSLEAHRSRTAYAADTDLVFGHPDTGNPYDASKMRKRFKLAIAAAEIRPVRFHDLRHTFGTQLAAAGCPMRTLQQYMGHRSHVTTLIYADYTDDDAAGARFAAAAFG